MLVKLLRVALPVMMLAVPQVCMAADDEYFFKGQQAYAERDYREAFQFWSQGAALGHPRALNGLGLLHRDGKGVDQDRPRAVELFRAASESGFSFAMYNLGAMLRDGQGIAASDIEACKWFILASTLNFDAKARLHKELIARRMSEAQVAEAHRLAQEWVDGFFFGAVAR